MEPQIFLAVLIRTPSYCYSNNNNNNNNNSVTLVRERAIPTEQPLFVGEINANFCGYKDVAWSARRIARKVNPSYTHILFSQDPFWNRSRSYDWRCQSVHLGVEPTLGLVTRYYFLSESCCLKAEVLFLLDAFSDDRTGLQFTVQSLNGSSRTEPVTILYCLIWDSLNLEGQVPICISPGTWWPSYTPGRWVPFSSLFRFAGLRWRYSNPHPQG
jgi:hypothetical protein